MAKVKLVPVHVMKVHVGVEVWLRSFLSRHYWWRQVVSFKPRLLYHGGKSTWYAFSIKLCGAQRQFRRFGEEVQPTVWSLMT